MLFKICQYKNISRVYNLHTNNVINVHENVVGLEEMMLATFYSDLLYCRTASFVFNNYTYFYIQVIINFSLFSSRIDLHFAVI